MSPVCGLNTEGPAMPYVFEHFMLDPGMVVRFLKVQEQCALLELTSVWLNSPMAAPTETESPQ